MGEQRLSRIAAEIQRELSELVRLEVRDPRVRLVTLTGVELSRDQSHAKVFFTTLGPPEEVEACAEGLSRAAGFLRSGLSHRLSTRTVPELHFSYDESIERGVRLSQLIDQAVATEGKPVQTVKAVKAAKTPKATAKKAAKTTAKKAKPKSRSSTSR
ncbi:30S ribosome-binding factor RbfA [Usitatibacter palustris]|uniref:Ribosome-binding factor A n=1 Tax=Usitatibacter palustris TaxID=2732487 RepID=A0A6M4H4K4_9PROT|nr:Ribosome-binding factor A [Usitatibacter palustris]